MQAFTTYLGLLNALTNHTPKGSTLHHEYEHLLQKFEAAVVETDQLYSRFCKIYEAQASLIGLEIDLAANYDRELKSYVHSRRFRIY